ncbi:MAG: monovalent cation/H(+) antiporter subunit G [Ilumatobacter sp.]|uniref:cation:proton antiporter n=1 Tax=Ilumatobacter sp. TaxID=1967498 RepID=UPI003C796ED4
MIAVHPVAWAFVLAGVAVIVLAAVGLLKLKTPYARIHAAGKASPVAFLIAAVGASLELGWAAGARLVVASVALILTLPLAVHLLFRALHNTEAAEDPPVDELREGHGSRPV